MALIRGMGSYIRFIFATTKKAHPFAEPRVLIYFASQSVQGPWLYSVASCKNPQKRENGEN